MGCTESTASNHLRVSQPTEMHFLRGHAIYSQVQSFNRGAAVGRKEYTCEIKRIVQNCHCVLSTQQSPCPECSNSALSTLINSMYQLMLFISAPIHFFIELIIGQSGLRLGHIAPDAWRIRSTYLNTNSYIDTTCQRQSEQPRI